MSVEPSCCTFSVCNMNMTEQEGICCRTKYSDCYHSCVLWLSFNGHCISANVEVLFSSCVLHVIGMYAINLSDQFAPESPIEIKPLAHVFNTG